MRFLLPILTVLFIICSCSKKDKNQNNSFANKNDYQTWLKEKEGYFSKGQIKVRFQKTIVTGQLSWAESRKNSNKDYQFMIVPFRFSASTYEGDKLLKEDEAAESYHLVFRKDKSGKIEARMKVRSYVKGTTSSENKVYESFYTLAGSYIASGVWINNKFYVLTDKPAGISNQKTSAIECTSEEINTSTFYCEGGSTATTCYYIRRHTIKYRCTYDPTTDQEPITWIDPEDCGYGCASYSEVVGEEYENKSIIDSLQGYPCAQDVLKQMPNINDKAKEILLNVFGVNDDINATFKPDNSMSIDDDGITTCGGSPSYFGCTIKLNATVLSQASKDYIAAILIHEAIHAYINYQRTILDTATFKIRFPIFWQYRGNDPQHNEMANNYVSIMSNIISGLNSGLSAENSEALAWGGLQGTTAWQNRSDTNYIKQVNHAGRNPTPSDISTYGLKSCD